MVGGEISRHALDQIRHATHEWASEWGEEAPKNVRAVLTTHDEGVRKIYGNRVRSTSDETYLVILEGAFTRSPSGSPKGDWAALFLTLSPQVAVRSYTVRPLSHVPDLVLEELGPVAFID
ncbi:hypothetical protein [Streptomyces sp. UNOC14_S4]|uniref:hypothetical protein n=1 Tax=Streptomyces sp. UNOC14_S4 TaxID=2872340 RepID=UPI001E3BC2A8|nr:hypothetical protein [Streptomyces sp. UNOC14_S4]MCC3768742.1 hypothetical protein [Streptomyces sp. UNOC14_S4]